MPVDPALLSTLEEAAASLNENPEDWTNTFGFPHVCTCDVDYANGDVHEIPACYARMVQDALNTCKLFRTALVRIATGTITEPEAYAAEFLT